MEPADFVRLVSIRLQGKGSMKVSFRLPMRIPLRYSPADLRYTRAATAIPERVIGIRVRRSTQRRFLPIRPHRARPVRKRELTKPPSEDRRGQGQLRLSLTNTYHECLVPQGGPAGRPDALKMSRKTSCGNAGVNTAAQTYPTPTATARMVRESLHHSKKHKSPDRRHRLRIQAARQWACR
jgi:hypothetical protein